MSFKRLNWRLKRTENIGGWRTCCHMHEREKNRQKKKKQNNIPSFTPTDILFNGHKC